MLNWRRRRAEFAPTVRPTRPVPKRAPLPGRVLNTALCAETGREVVMIETLPVQAGGFVDLRFERARTDWRRGVWLAVEGLLEVAGQAFPQFSIWTDTAPPLVTVRVAETSSPLHLYNVWDSRRGIRRESQSASSGMVLLGETDGWRRYGCNDIGRPPDFEKLVFSVRVR